MIKPDLTLLPDHTEELANALALTKKTYKKFIKQLADGHVTPLKRKTYKYIFEHYLYAVADMSLEFGESIEDDLRKHYTVTYKDTPALGNKLYYEEYFGLFNEYDKVKKAIWKAIFKVDEDGIVDHEILY